VGLLGSVLVVAAGWVVAKLPVATPVLGWGPLGRVRDQSWSHPVATAVILLGVALLGYAWLALLRRTGAGLGWVRGTAALWTAPFLLAPPLFSNDGWSYAAQGTLVASGLSPYRYGPGALDGPLRAMIDHRWLETPTPYGPVPLWFGGRLARVVTDPLLLAMAHRLLAVLGLVLLAWALPRLARRCGADPVRASALVLCSPAVLVIGAAGMHNDVLMIGLMAAAVAAAAERGWIIGAAVAGVAAAVKVPGGLACLAIVLIALPAGAPMRARLVRTAGVGVVAAAVLLALGWVSGLGQGWLSALSVPGAVITPLSLMALLGTGLDRALGTHRLADLARQAGQAVALLVTVVLLLRRRSGRPDTAVAALALSLGLLVALGPVVQLWYLLWPLPFLAALRLRADALAGLVIGSLVLALFGPVDPLMHETYKVVAPILLGLGAIAALTNARFPWLARVGRALG